MPRDPINPRDPVNPRGPLCQRQPRGAGCPVNRRLQPHRAGRARGSGAVSRPRSSPRRFDPIAGDHRGLSDWKFPGKVAAIPRGSRCPAGRHRGFWRHPRVAWSGRHKPSVRAVRRALLPGEGRDDRPTPGPPGPWGDRGDALCPPGIAVPRRVEYWLCLGLVW